MTVRIKSSVKMDGRIILDRFIPEINLSNNSVAENASIGTVVGTATVQNAVGSTFTFELVDEDGTGDFSMTTGGVISVASALNHEEQSVYPVQIKSIDSRGHKYAIATNLIVGDVNEPPVDISLDNNTYDLTLTDNVGKSVAFASAVDPDEGETITWSLGTDASGRFSIDPSTGEISVAGSLASDSYQINVIATDTGSNTYDEDFIINVSALSEQKIQAFEVSLSAVEQQKITASDAQNSDLFGRAVSISEDGNTAIVGAYLEDTGGSDAGAAYIFTRSGSTWTEQAKIQASDKQSGDRFGRSVSISSDGNTAIVGARYEDTGGSDAGAAYIFTRSGTSWTEQAKIQASDKQTDDFFGYSVSISEDGNTAIVGANGEDAGGLNAGAAYIFTRSGSTWTEQQKLTASDTQSLDNFGWSVSISSDGNTAIIGAYGEDTGGTNAGAAYIFVWDGTNWTEETKIQASDKQGSDFFGYSVSISEDGNTAIVGAYTEDTGGTDAGAAYIFTRSGSTWTEQAKIQASDKQSDDFFGLSVSISSDGNTAIVGAYGEDTGGTNAGAAYVFARSGTAWIEQQKIQASDNQGGDNFGIAVALSGDGKTAIAGANGEDTGGTDAGAAYIFDIQKTFVNDAQISDLFGHSSSISADGNTIIVGTPGEDTGGSSTGAAYIFVWNGSTWVEEAKIQSNDGQAGDNFGWVTDISSDGNTVIVGAPFKNEGATTNVGAAYVFTRSGSTWSQQQKLSGTSSAASYQFGIEVSISDNGENIVIGERYDDTINPDAGATYVFILSGSTWVQQQKITPAGLSANSSFGRAVDISGDSNNSNTLISSANGADDGRGSVFIFTRSGSTWTQEAKIQPAGLNPNDFFGRSVAISEDGNTVVVGAFQDDTNGLNSGSVFVFTRSGTVWTQQQKIQSTDAISKSQFGLDVDITNNGDTIIIGAYIEDAISLDSGAAYIFTRTSGVWTEQTRILSSDLEAGDELGFSVSLNSSGNKAVVGARREDTGGTDAGAVYIFE